MIAATAWRAARGGLAGPLRAAALVIALGVPLVALLALMLAALGYAPGPALRALWGGSLGSWYALTSATLVRATPLILTGLAVALAFRAGVWNIGAEGQFLVGAAGCAALGVAGGGRLGVLALPAALAAGALLGAAWAGIAALLRRRGVLEVISTIMLNFVALHLVGWLVRGPLQEPLGIYPQTAPIAEAVRLPRLLPGGRLHAGLLLALAAAVLLWWVLTRTAAGFRVLASGANPHAAHMAGLVNVPATSARAFLASGALAGLAGAVEVSGVTLALYENISPGYGYTAIAVALLAGLQPLGVALSGVLFGALQAGAGAMQRDAGVPSVIVAVLEALLILAVLAAARLGPAAGGARAAWARMFPGAARATAEAA